MNILILGDGNFSFSKDFFHLLGASDDLSLNRFVATSFDCIEDLKAKYPETKLILPNLLAKGAKILHDIDATRPLSSQLESQGIPTDEKFDHIFFNFPHLGFEDCKTHASMIGHIFFSILSVLKHDDDHHQSTFYLALAQSQSERWNIFDMAERNGFEFIEGVPLGRWPSYELKRHHTGASFKRRIDQSFHYCFRRKSSKYNASSVETIRIPPTNLMRIINHKLETTPPPTVSSSSVILDAVVNIDSGSTHTVQSCDISSPGATTGDNTRSEILVSVLAATGQFSATPPPIIKTAQRPTNGNGEESKDNKNTNKQTNKKRRKVNVAVEGGYIRRVAPGVVPPVLGVVNRPQQQQQQQQQEEEENTSSSLVDTTLAAATAVTLTAAGSGERNGDDGWECLTCKKVLGTEQGIRTHVYMMHILASTGNHNGGAPPSSSPNSGSTAADAATATRARRANGVSTSNRGSTGGDKVTATSSRSGDHEQLAGAELLVDDVGSGSACVSSSSTSTAAVPSLISLCACYVCEYCGKEVNNADALFQHKRAKHQGLYTDIKPSWAAAAAAVTTPPTAAAATTTEAGAVSNGSSIVSMFSSSFSGKSTSANSSSSSVVSDSGPPESNSSSSSSTRRMRSMDDPTTPMITTISSDSTAADLVQRPLTSEGNNIPSSLIDRPANNISSSLIDRPANDISSSLIDSHTIAVITQQQAPVTVLAIVGNQDNNNTNLQCPICGLTYDSTEAVQRHMNGWQPIRMTEKTFECSRCNKKFSDDRGLKQHTNFCVTKMTMKEEKNTE